MNACACGQPNYYSLPANSPKGWQCTGCRLWDHVYGKEPPPAEVPEGPEQGELFPKSKRPIVLVCADDGEAPRMRLVRWTLRHRPGKGIQSWALEIADYPRRFAFVLDGGEVITVWDAKAKLAGVEEYLGE